MAPALFPDGWLGVDVPTLRVLVLMQLVAAHSVHERVVAVQVSSASHTGHLGSVSGQSMQRRKMVLPENSNARSRPGQFEKSSIYVLDQDLSIHSSQRTR